ncbi:MAG: peptide chain release factor N(5)-glutamine methyltransferase, partial [Chloroflexota bacterium]
MHNPNAETRTPQSVDEALRRGKDTLARYSSSPRLDVEILLAHVLGMSRAALLARPEQRVDAESEGIYSGFLERRKHGEPTAYLTGHKEFYDLDLLITRDVLVPRPETESVVEACLADLPESDEATFADIGTGSGAILVAVTTHRPRLRAYGTDISPEAIAVAARNCERYNVSGRVRLFVGNLCDPLPEPVNVIAANLPYVPPDEASLEVATWEPNVAVFGGGADGSALIRQFLAQAPRYLLPGGT